MSRYVDGDGGLRGSPVGRGRTGSARDRYGGQLLLLLIMAGGMIPKLGGGIGSSRGGCH